MMRMLTVTTSMVVTNVPVNMVGPETEHTVWILKSAKK